MNEMDSMGYLRIWITSAGGTVPVQGIPVQVSDGEGNLLHVLRTGESGLTKTVALSAPPADESLVPGTHPYTNYLVTIEGEGFAPIRELSVPIFDGITSLQPITLLPSTEPHATPKPYLVLSTETEGEAYVDDMDLPEYGKTNGGENA